MFLPVLNLEFHLCLFQLAVLGEKTERMTLYKLDIWTILITFSREIYFIGLKP